MLELNRKAIEAARFRIQSGQYNDSRQTYLQPLEPSTISDYIDRYGWSKYASWFLAVDTDEDEFSALRYHLPYGDLQYVSRAQLQRALYEAHRCGESNVVYAAVNLLQQLDED